jgi:hypothetical protein
MTMLGRLISFAIVAAVSVGSFGAQDLPATTPVITDSEAYAVYAAAVAASIDRTDPPQKLIAIQLETAASNVCSRDRPISPEWGEVVTSYKRENSQTKFLLPGFPLGASYSLIPYADVRKMLVAGGHIGPNAPHTNCPGCAVFASFPGGRLLVLSAIGFNTERTRAIVAVQEDCILASNREWVCHGGYVLSLEKKDGRWTATDSGFGCHWVA